MDDFVRIIVYSRHMFYDREDQVFTIEELSTLSRHYDLMIEDQSMPGHLLLYDANTVLHRMGPEGKVTSVNAFSLSVSRSLSSTALTCNKYSCLITNGYPCYYYIRCHG